jgi:hypothetical protein
LKPSRNSGAWGLTVLAAALAPALAAIWTVPWFVTQDGPAHVYNAQILAWSFDPGSPFRDVYTIQWQPIPNWVGHLALAGLVSVLPAWVADRIMTSVTLAVFAVSILWLRWRVAGGRNLPAAALLASLLALNITWLFGFTSFLLGACLFPITLGFWWTNQARWNAGHMAVLAVLLVLGYFCHLVSLGLTVLCLVVLVVASPLADATETSQVQRRIVRLAGVSVSFLPLIPLGLCYLQLAHRGGPMQPLWENLADPLSPRAWKEQITWVDPLTLARKDALPFTDRVSPVFLVCAPVVWFAVTVAICGGAGISAGLWTRFRKRSDRSTDLGDPSMRAWTGPRGERRGWLILAVVLLAGGIAGPDTLGPDHGEYLPQRVLLFGLVACVPLIDIDARKWWGWAATASLALAVVLQSAIVWDYALYSDRTAGQIIRAHDLVGRNRRLVTLPVTIRSRFRANPLLHVESWLGVDSGNVAWNNYETRHYYFPVQFRPGIDRPHPDQLEHVLKHDGPQQAADRSREWERILSDHADSIDVLLVYKREPRLDAITQRWFDVVEARGDVRVCRRIRNSSWPRTWGAGSPAPQRPLPAIAPGADLPVRPARMNRPS